MALLYTTDKLIDAIKRRASIPSTQALFTDQQFVDVANDEMEVTLVPALMAASEEFFVQYVDVEVPASAGPYTVEIPKQAVGMKLREIVWVDPSTGSLRNLPRLELERVSANGIIGDSSYSGFMIQGNKIILTPNTSGGTLRVYFFARPLNLCLLQDAGRVTSVDTVNNIIVLNNLPNDWIVGDSVNVIGSSQPFATKVVSATITVLSSPSVTLDTVEGISVGDYVSLEGYSPVPQLPVEAHKVLAQAAAVQCLQSMGDAQGMQVAAASLQKNLADMLNLIAPRVTGEVKRVVNINSPWRSGWDWGR